MNNVSVYDVVGIGNAIVDVLAKVSDDFLIDRGIVKGSMVLLDAKKAADLYKEIDPERTCSGGSVANTVAGIASLGGTPSYIGKVHNDELGMEFKRDIGAAGVDFYSPMLNEGPSTARCIVLVTPDAERTMLTYLGACTKLTEDDIDEKLIQNAKVVYLEGYLWDEEYAKKAMIKACELAHKYDKKVAFTLSDSFCVDRHRKEFKELIENHVDVLFANDEEIKSLYEEEDFYKAIDMVKEDCEVSAITRNLKGSVVVSGKVKTFVESELVEYPVDTTGAGDLYAAGFLAGYTSGEDLGTCALMGGITAAEIITHYGARPEVSLRGLVRNKLKEYKSVA